MLRAFRQLVMADAPGPLEEAQRWLFLAYHGLLGSSWFKHCFIESSPLGSIEHVSGPLDCGHAKPVRGCRTPLQPGLG